MLRYGMLGSLAIVGIIIAVPVPPDRVSRPIGEVALPPNPPPRTEVTDGVPGRSGARRGGPLWAVPRSPDEVSRPIGEVALPAWITTPSFE